MTKKKIETHSTSSLIVDFGAVLHTQKVFKFCSNKIETDKKFVLTKKATQTVILEKKLISDCLANVFSTKKCANGSFERAQDTGIKTCVSIS